MANRRCLSKDFYYNDKFLSLPLSAIVLYTYFNLCADDDGFVVNPKTVMRVCNASESDVDNLVEREFIIKFDSGNLLIKHWLQHNTLKKDNAGHYHPTKCIEDKAKVTVNEIKEYVFADCFPNGTETEPKRKRNITQLNSTQENITESNTNQINSKKANSRKESSRENPQKIPTDEELSEMFSGKEVIYE